MAESGRVNIADLPKRHPEAWHRATRHEFLDAVRDGTVPESAFDRWLAQDYAFVGHLLRFQARLHGPCFRCLGDAALEIPVSAREYQAASPENDEELRTAYLENDRLDLSAWARDAVALELADKILCRRDCGGLCPVCGKDLNAEPHEHGEPEPDSRWAALAELKDQL